MPPAVVTAAAEEVDVLITRYVEEDVREEVEEVEEEMDEDFIQ